MDAISCLAPLPFLSSSPYTDATITSGLRFSSMSSDSSYTPFADLFADFASAPAPEPVVSCCDPVKAAHSAAGPRESRAAGKQSGRLGPAAAGAGAGRAGKRRARASKRAPTTYISTDPSNFRLMVQHITGVQADPAGAPAPTFHDAVLLADAPVFGGYQPLPADDAPAPRDQQEPCYPTLDSWSVLYESNELAAALTHQ